VRREEILFRGIVLIKILEGANFRRGEIWRKRIGCVGDFNEIEC